MWEIKPILEEFRDWYEEQQAMKRLAAEDYRTGWYARHQGQPYSRHNSRFWRAGWKASDREQAAIQRVEEVIA